tara:strand:+ start:256 stop:444 length:189 start_codon:yes stop_codon:yes gene_type:complete
MADDYTVQDVAYTTGYWTEAVVRGTILALPAIIVFTLAVMLMYLMMGKTLGLSRTDMSPVRG